jgi:hypothetical protein
VAHTGGDIMMTDEDVPTVVNNFKLDYYEVKTV